MTRFSIIIPCYNAAGTLSETLRSIANQTYDAWDVICIDDGSTDATCDILRNACARDPRICFIKNDGKGPSRARNLGALSVAQGDIVAFCDADDIWGPDKLAQLADCFADQEVDAAYGQIAFFQNDPAKAQVFSTVPRGPLTIPMLLGKIRSAPCQTSLCGGLPLSRRRGSMKPWFTTKTLIGLSGWSGAVRGLWGLISAKPGIAAATTGCPPTCLQ